MLTVLHSHMNNPIYGVLIDSVINSFLIQKTGYRPGYSDDASDHIGLVGSSYCDYFGACHYPGTVDCGLRVVKMGKSSLMCVFIFSATTLDLADLFHVGTKWASSKEEAKRSKQLGASSRCE